MSKSKEWLEGRASALQYVDQEMRNLVAVFTEGTSDFELAILQATHSFREDLSDTEEAIQQLTKE